MRIKNYKYDLYFYVIPANVDSWRAEINNIMGIVKYGYDEYFKL